MIIYKTTNLINGKIYIGLDTHNNPNYFGSGKLLNKAVKKYGIKYFIKDILDEAKTIEELNEKEIYWIAHFNSTNRKNGYNITNGGAGHNYKHYKQTKIKIGLAHTGMKRTAETKLNISLSKRGKKLSEKHKQIIKENTTGKNNPMYGKKHSKETKEKIGKANSGRILFFSDEHREKLSRGAKSMWERRKSNGES